MKNIYIYINILSKLIKTIQSYIQLTKSLLDKENLPINTHNYIRKIEYCSGPFIPTIMNQNHKY